jgi:hypothetical protein
MQAKMKSAPARGSGSRDQDAALGTKQPEGGRDHDENAQPRDLTGGPENGVGRDSETKPEDRGVRCCRLQGAKAAIETDEHGEQAKDVAHVGDGEQKVERRESQGESGDDCVAFGDAATDQGALKEKSGCQGYEERAHTYGSEGEAEELDEGSAEVELPANHGRRPPVVDDVSGGGEGLCHEDIGAVVRDTHVDVGTADEFADQHAESAEKSWKTEFSHDVQRPFQARSLADLR